MVSKTAFTLPAFAKINWTLHVLGRRPDGYHELHTIFQTVSLHDRLTFAPQDDEQIHLSCDAPDIPVDETNLVHRAAVALRDRRGLKKGASIHLEKRIPVGGGLGGGSSDAAITLLGLAHLWEISIAKQEILEISAHLGADVPFFLMGGTALGTGLGTDVSPLPEVTIPHILIVTPNVKISTAEAYKALDAPALTKVGGDTILSISRADAQFTDSLPMALHNDFERVIFRLNPEIERAKKALINAGARNALLAGSGASVFGIFDNREAQEEQVEEVLRIEAGWRVFSCATISRAQYQQALGLCAAPLEALS